MKAKGYSFQDGFIFQKTEIATQRLEVEKRVILERSQQHLNDMQSHRIYRAERHKTPSKSPQISGIFTLDS